ncbi:MAG: SLBB domain-containing protein [Ignavibacteria bacterium]|nr:SLBB domain-containing protein [Ignavibacteria bacterium]
MKFCILLLVLLFNDVFAQEDGLILGKTPKLSTAAVYDLSDPTGVNMEINLWGFVRFPGRYIVPLNTTFLDLMSYAGGPTESSNLKEIRILRNKGSDKTEIIKLDYEDLLWDEKISSKTRLNPVLQAGDVILIMEEKRYTFREDVSFYIPILSAIISVATLIITITNRQ